TRAGSSVRRAILSPTLFFPVSIVLPSEATNVVPAVSVSVFSFSASAAFCWFEQPATNASKATATTAVEARRNAPIPTIPFICCSFSFRPRDDRRDVRRVRAGRSSLPEPAREPVAHLPVPDDRISRLQHPMILVGEEEEPCVDPLRLVDVVH